MASKFSQFIEGITPYVPGGQLAKGLGFMLSEPFLTRTQQEMDNIWEKTNQIILEHIKTTTNEEERQRLINALAQNKKYDVMENIYKDVPTGTQIAASAAELAAFAALGLKPTLPQAASFKSAGTAIKTMNIVKKAEEAEKIAEMTKAGRVLYKTATLGLETIKQAGIGAGLFALSEASMNADAQTKSILNAAKQGALIGGGVTLGTAGLAAGVGATARVLKEPLKKAGEKIVSGLEKAAAGEEKATEAIGESIIDKTLSYIGEGGKTLKQKAAQVGLKFIEEGKKLEARLIDRFSPLKRIENRLIELNKGSGRPLEEYEKVYRDARILQTISDRKAEDLVNELSDKLIPYKDIRREYTAYLTQLDFIDRAKLGNVVPGEQTVDQTIDNLAKIVQEMGPEKAKRAEQVRQIVNDFNHSLLQERVDVGLISQETMNALIAAHPNYIPHNVILDIEERNLFAISDSLNVSKTDIMKAFGSLRNIQDPIEAISQRTQIATRLIEKNKLLNNLIRAQEEHGIMTGARKLGEGETKKLGEETINFFRNGIKETWVVPSDVAVAIKNLDAPLNPKWFRLVTTPNKILKAFSTKYNISFTLPNKFRDKQTAILTSKAFIDELVKRYGLRPEPELETILKNPKKYYREAGGFGSSIFKEGEDKIWKQLQKTGIAEKFAENINPAVLIDKINTRIEEGTRLEVFKEALKRGLSLKDAALASRNATVDFAKMGTWMQPLNQLVPFLNARVQGFVNLPTALINNPETFARMQLYTAVYPSMLLHQYNRRFESYKNISQYIKNKYWVIMVGETDGIDSYTGNKIKVPQFVTIPKGEGQALVSSPIQWYLEKQDGIDFRKTSEILADTIGAASPLAFQMWGQSNFAGSFISQLGPLATMWTGTATGVSPLTGYPIVPESRKKAPVSMQFTRTTPESTKALANLIGVSPAMLDFYINSWGGLPQDMQNAVELVYGVVKEGKWGGNSISDTPFGAVGKLPVAERFIREAGTYGSPEQQYREKQKQKIEEQVTGKKLTAYDKAEKIFQEMNKRKTYDERLSYLNAINNELTPEIRNRLKTLQTSRSTVEALSKTDSDEVRATYIFQRLMEMKNYNERVKFLDELEKAKILTPEVRKIIKQLKQLY